MPQALTVDRLMTELAAFAGRVDELLQLLGVDGTSLVADHIALRVNSEDKAGRLSEEFAAIGKKLSSQIINGRPINVYQLDDPLIVGRWQIACVELPFPGEKCYPVEGWEHIEFVIASDEQDAEGYQRAVLKRFPNLQSQWSELSNKGIVTKLSSPKGEGERLANPTLAFKYNGVCIKLHPHSLQAIIASEQD